MRQTIEEQEILNIVKENIEWTDLQAHSIIIILTIMIQKTKKNDICIINTVSL